MRTLLAAAALAAALAAPALADGEATLGDISIRDAWARASLGPAPNSAAYMTLETSAEQPDRLVGASSPAAEAVQLHVHMMDGDIARMRPVDAVEVAPGELTVLRPGGLHLMLVRPRQPLTAGETLPLTLVFEQAGEVTLEVPIRPIGAGAVEHDPGADHHGAHDQGGAASN